MASVTRRPLFQVQAHDQSAVAEVRRIARAAALEVDMSDVDAERAAIVATEATTNVIKHAGGGHAIVRIVESDGAAAVDVIAIDRGPGMSNVAECLRDGYSSAGTRGHGLGAIARQSSMFDVFSRPGQGTVLMARVTGGSNRKPAPDATRARAGLLVDGLAIPMKGQPVCGDAWAEYALDAGALILVADGLGHGETAAEASDEAVRAFHRRGSAKPVDVLDQIHRALLKTRGAAVAVAHVDRRSGEVRYGGIGNISATLDALQDGQRHLVSVHGTAGHRVRRLQEFGYPWQDGAVLVIHSDGVNAHWALEKYPGLSARHPAVIAAVLLRDFSRGRDDATVVVAKNLT
jgi:anti-sigma regulatory factor (Ser/Thr protein kinase)